MELVFWAVLAVGLPFGLFVCFLNYQQKLHDEREAEKVRALRAAEEAQTRAANEGFREMQRQYTAQEQIRSSQRRVRPMSQRQASSSSGYEGNGSAFLQHNAMASSYSTGLMEDTPRSYSSNVVGGGGSFDGGGSSGDWSSSSSSISGSCSSSSDSSSSSSSSDSGSSSCSSD